MHIAKAFGNRIRYNGNTIGFCLQTYGLVDK